MYLFIDGFEQVNVSWVVTTTSKKWVSTVERLISKHLTVSRFTFSKSVSLELPMDKMKSTTFNLLTKSFFTSGAIVLFIVHAFFVGSTMQFDHRKNLVYQLILCVYWQHYLIYITFVLSIPQTYTCSKGWNKFKVNDKNSKTTSMTSIDFEGFLHIYWRNPWWKISFFVPKNSLHEKYFTFHS